MRFSFSEAHSPTLPSCIGELARLRADAQATLAMGFRGAPLTRTVAIGPVTNNIVISTAPGADANAIGDAAGSAIGNAMRGVMGDLPAMP